MDRPLTDDERLAILADWRASGLSGPVYARERGINLHTLRMWTRKLRAQLNEALAPGAASPRVVTPSFVEFVLPTEGADVGALVVIEVVVAGATVRVPRGADGETLARVFSALRGDA